MPAALAEIRRAGVGPTDIQQAAIGPGIGIFTRHAQVLNTDGTPMLVKDALKLINQVREELASTATPTTTARPASRSTGSPPRASSKGSAGDAINMMQRRQHLARRHEGGRLLLGRARRCPPAEARGTARRLGSRQRHHAHRLGSLPASDQAPDRRDRRHRCGGRALQSLGSSRRARPRARPPPLRHLRTEAVGGRGARLQPAAPGMGCDREARGRARRRRQPRSDLFSREGMRHERT